MNIYDISKKARVPLKALQRLDKLGVLKVDPDNGKLSRLIFHMRKNMRYTLPMLVWLIDEPDLIDELGYVSKRYQTRAEKQIAELGDIAATIAPKHVTAEIRQAGKGDDDAALVIAEWLKDVLPGEPVGHDWIAARLLVPLNEFLREQALPMISLAMLNVRRLPEFSGYWRSEKIGTRNQIRYFQKITLDL